MVAVAGNLVADGRPLEVQHFGFQLLQHLVRVIPSARLIALAVYHYLPLAYGVNASPCEPALCLSPKLRCPAPALASICPLASFAGTRALVVASLQLPYGSRGPLASQALTMSRPATFLFLHNRQITGLSNA